MKKYRNIVFLALLVFALLLGVGWLCEHLRTLNTIKASVGEWTSKNFDTRDITRVNIRVDAGHVIVHEWGRAHPTESDWGEATASASGGVLSVIWKQGFATKTQTLRPLSDGSLQLTTHCHFTDNSGRPDYDTTNTFAKGLVHDWSDLPSK